MHLYTCVSPAGSKLCSITTVQSGFCSIICYYVIHIDENVHVCMYIFLGKRQKSILISLFRALYRMTHSRTGERR